MAFIVDYLTENTATEFEYVKLPVLFPERGPKYILADYRDYQSYAKNPHWCVHSATASPASLLRNLQWAGRGTKRIMVFEAMSRTQVAAWLQNRGYATSTQVHPQHVHPGTLNELERVMINSTAREIQRLEMVARQAQERLLYLQSLPAEPEGKNPVIKFKRRFTPGGKKYTYAAIRTAQGWYTTGPRTPKAYAWQDLITWINEIEPVDVKIMIDQRSVATLSGPVTKGGAVQAGNLGQ